MTKLSFHKSLYSGTAVDQAVKLYGPHARFELAETPEAWVVQVSHDDAKRERRVTLELSNYALGLTVKQRQEAP